MGFAGFGSNPGNNLCPVLPAAAQNQTAFLVDHCPGNIAKAGGKMIRQKGQDKMIRGAAGGITAAGFRLKTEQPPQAVKFPGGFVSGGLDFSGVGIKPVGPGFFGSHTAVFCFRPGRFRGVKDFFRKAPDRGLYGLFAEQGVDRVVMRIG